MGVVIGCCIAFVGVIILAFWILTRGEEDDD